MSWKIGLKATLTRNLPTQQGEQTIQMATQETAMIHRQLPDSAQLSRQTPNNLMHLDAIWVPDAVPALWTPPNELAIGKSTAISLMQPQQSARRLLPRTVFETLYEFATRGVPTNCGPDWPNTTINVACNIGPQVSALTPANTKLIWDNVSYQAEAGFVKVTRESKLFANLKSCGWQSSPSETVEAASS
jgi:hypothetical protein